MESIIGYELFNPAIDPIFDPIAASFYWSSTTDADVPSTAWLVGFVNGGDGVGAKSDLLFVRAVRGGPKPKWII